MSNYPKNFLRITEDSEIVDMSNGCFVSVEEIVENFNSIMHCYLNANQENQRLKEQIKKLHRSTEHYNKKVNLDELTN